MFKTIKKVTHTKEGREEINRLLDNYNFRACNYYGGTLFDNEDGDEMLIILDGWEDTITAKKNESHHKKTE